MNYTTFEFNTVFARRIPDPTFKNQHGTEKHYFVMPVSALPLEIGNEPNARQPNLNKRVYKKVEKTLLNQDSSLKNLFYQKNKGITIIAESVTQTPEGKFNVKMELGKHGIVDGGHTYELICKHIRDGTLPKNDEEQYVTLEIRTGIPEDWIPEIAAGLNTSVQVQSMSLDNLGKKFDWIKDELKSESYSNIFAWSENDDGDMDARDLVSLMLMFNIDLYPNNKGNYPIRSYSSREKNLETFEQKPESFLKMRPILKDILVLHDTIKIEASDFWGQAVEGGRAGKLRFIDWAFSSDNKKAEKYIFPFIEKKGDYRLIDPALYPILSAFRWYVIETSNGFEWRDGFEKVLSAWRELAPQLLKSTKSMVDDLRGNVNSLGKSRAHWENMHNSVAKSDLVKEAA